MQALFGGVAPDWLWIGFTVGIVALLLADVLLFHRKAHVVPPREALLVSGFWIGLALCFNGWFAYQYGLTAGGEFLAGYLIEKSLSMDNVFVILLILTSLRIPGEFQHRVLFWGIFGAIVMRGILILIGAQLIERFNWILYIFGGILIYSAIKFLREGDEEHAHIDDHVAVRLLRKVFKVVGQLHGQKFFVHIEGILHATPLFVALVLIEVTDLVFAVDSIPAVFAVTRDPFIAFGSNILAILGLRALYFVIANWVKDLRYLKPGLAVLLAFVGVKMLIVEFVHIPIWVSLTVIAGILTTAGLGSWFHDRVDRRREDSGG